MPFTIHCPENNIRFNLSIRIPSISNKTNSSVPLNFFTHKYLGAWLNTAVEEQLKVMIHQYNSFLLHFHANFTSDLPSSHHDVSEALHSYTANRMMVHAIKMQDRNVYLPNNHQLVGWTYDESLLATHIVDNFSRKSPWL
jgi:hypothetical protein